MKKILSLLVLLAVFTSCEEDVKFNTPAVQALKNNELWKADNFTATVGPNGLTVEATFGFETLVLKTAGVNPSGTYNLGVNNSSVASYTLDVDSQLTEEYRTGANLGSGQIKLTATDTDFAAGYVTGTFYFRGVSDSGEEVYFQNGVFYRIPVTGTLE